MRGIKVEEAVVEFTGWWVLALLGIIAVQALSPRVGVAAPLGLVLLGIGVGLLPFVPVIEIDPHWVLGTILPPLLYSAAVNMPAIDLRRDVRIISGLSVSLVVASAVSVGLLLHLALPELGVAYAIAAGAIVSPTDAVATSIVRKAGVSPRIVTVLEGESLLNDATALVILRAALAAAVVSISAFDIGKSFVYAIVVAGIIGYLVGKANLLIRARLPQAQASVALSFAAPFVAFLPAEHLHASGLVAAVVAGLVTGNGAPRYLSAEDRMTEHAVWHTLELVLESAIFLLMGLQLYGLLVELREEHSSAVQAAGLGLACAVLILLVRAGAMTVFFSLLGRRAQRRQAARADLLAVRAELAAGGDLPPDQVLTTGLAPLPGRSRRARADSGSSPLAVVDQRRVHLDYLSSLQFGWREGAVLVWAGMRGAVTLAAAQSLPADTPLRALLILIGFVVAVSTLLVQGLSLPWLVTRLGLHERDDISAAEHATQLSRLWASLQATAAARLDDPHLRRPDGRPYSEQSRAELAGELASWQADEQETLSAQETRALRLELLATQRVELLRLRDVGEYPSPVLGEALAQIDADHVAASMRRAPEAGSARGA